MNMNADAPIATAKKKGKSQRAISVFAKYYTPILIVAAVMTAVVPSLITGDWNTWIHRSLIMLVAACPCAVVLYVPLAFFSSMGAAAKNGIIIKGSCYIEALSKADTVVFDKTGTLTTGELKVGKIHATEGFSDKEILCHAAMCEYYSAHPIAKAIVEKNGATDVSDVHDFTESAGGGTSDGVIYIGDGINDAPVLAGAHVGIAMGLGTRAACESADIILTNSELHSVAYTVRQSKRTMSVLKQNIALSVAVKLIVIILGIIGIAPMWSAIVADVGTMIISVANSSRLMKIIKAGLQ